MIPRKKPRKSETVKIPQERDFCHLEHSVFCKKVKQFVRKYYITWLIHLANKCYDVEEFLISFYAICY